MTCAFCASGNQAEFTAEINVHFRGLENINRPGVLVFPKLLVCFNCGSTLFSIPETELKQLARRPGKREASTPERTVDEVVLRRKIALGA
jgi:hypothetical protein